MSRARAAPSWFGLVKESVWLKVGGFLILWASIMLVIAFPDARLERRYAREGRRADAVVTSKWMLHAGDGRKSTEYMIGYRFRTGAGQEITGRTSIDADPWEALGEGSPFPIIYIADAPALNRDASASGWLTTQILVGVVAIVWIAGAGVLVVGFRRIAPRTRPTGGLGEGPRPAASSTPVRRSGTTAPSWFGVQIGVWTFLGLLLLTIGGLFALIGGLFLFDEYRYRTQGVRTEALVLAKGIAESSGPGGAPQSAGTTENAWVSYRFVTRDGRTVKGQDDDVLRSVWSRVIERHPVEIEYLPVDPSKSRVPPHAPGGLIWLIAALGSALTVLGACSFCYGVLDDSRRKRRGPAQSIG